MDKVVSDISNSKTSDFLMVCPSSSGIAQAIHALYYLPENYRLVVLAQVAAQEKLWAEHSDMMNRVQFESKEELSAGASPFSSAYAVIADSEASELSASGPMVLLSENAEHDIESTGTNRFAVSTDSPEALASAILKIAKSPRALSPEIHQYA